MITGGVSTMSLGFPVARHSLPYKLYLAASHGFKAVEMYYPCLEHYANNLALPEGTSFRLRMKEASRRICELCKELDLKIICLQPFMQYEGLINTQEHADKLKDAAFRMELCNLLGTDLMLVPSSFLTDGVSPTKITTDLQELADLGLQRDPPIRIAYEAMCWGTHVYAWQQSWDLVSCVDRPNFGLVLDTFHIAGWDFADPFLPSFERVDGDERLENSLEELKRIDPAKIFFVQVADGARPEKPITSTSDSPYYDPALPSRMSWSRHCRVYPFEEGAGGGFLPIEPILEAIIGTGFQGYMSFEIFNESLYQADDRIPLWSAARAQASWKKIAERFNLYHERFGVSRKQF